MEIKYKLYPYPVLSSYSDDYKQGRFEANIDIVKDGYNLRIDFLANLTSEGLKEQIKDGNAMYVYHLECAQTGYRKVVVTDKVSESYIVENKLVSGKLQICPFVVAVKDISGYSTEDFHNDYSGVAVDIEAGCVMAVGTMVTVDVSKDIDDLANTPSIFSIIGNADSSCREMLVDMSGRKIIIKLPLDDYYNYKKLSITPQYQSVLNSLTVIPALTYVLGELKLMTVQDRMENQDTLWYKTISKALLTQFDCDVESKDFNSRNSIELAQKLVNNPVSEAFHILTSSFGVSGGDDE
jgi:hypothetical protein